MSPIAAVLFDMDGLLLDTERISVKAWTEVCSGVFSGASHEFYLSLIGHRREDCLSLLESAMGEMKSQALELMDAVSLRYQEMLDGEPIPVKKGAIELLEHLQQAGCPCAVGTSTRRSLAEEKLRRAGLLKYFKSVTGGDEVKKGKPAPDLYLLAARRTGVNIGNCMVFEDSGPGIRAGHAAGALPVLVPDLRIPEEVVKEGLTFAVLESLDQAIQYFDFA